jgi:hypothetical protein
LFYGFHRFFSTDGNYKGVVQDAYVTPAGMSFLKTGFSIGVPYLSK